MHPLERPVVLIACVVLATLGSHHARATEAEHPTRFSVSGDLTVSVEQATATMLRIRGKIPALTIQSAPASIRKLGKSYSVNLFFSNEFDPKPGTYPVQFGYRGEANTLGGSFMGGGSRFSHDTEGTAEFVEFGEQVRVRFEFRVFDKSEGTEGRRGVTVRGEATCARADIF
jgi:hypothetical protein